MICLGGEGAAAPSPPNPPSPARSGRAKLSKVAMCVSQPDPSMCEVDLATATHIRETQGDALPLTIQGSIREKDVRGEQKQASCHTPIDFCRVAWILCCSRIACPARLARLEDACLAGPPSIGWPRSLRSRGGAAGRLAVDGIGRPHDPDAGHAASPAR